MTPRTPKVSVFIPTYNRADMLRESIGSVLKQTYGDFELIISDNASDDGTESVVRSFNDPRIRYFKNDQNIGSRGNWNRCFVLARGEYVTILPDDDLMLPENLERKVQVLSGSEQVGFVHSQYHLIDADGQIIARNRDAWGGSDRTSDCLENRQEMFTNPWNFVNCSTVVFRWACYRKFGGFTEELFTGWDYEYWLRIAAYYDVAFLASSLVSYRVHKGSETELFTGSDPLRMFGTDMLVKRLFIKNHLNAKPEDQQIRREIWRRMGRTLAELVEEIQKQGRCGIQARKLILKYCLSFPVLLRLEIGRKVLLESMLGSRATGALKRFYLSFR
jgi:glycosyltransferase involved in cell wall biosynthesis